MKINPEKLSGISVKKDNIKDNEDDKLTSSVEFSDRDVEEGILG
jgi:hypothetical protein